EHLVEPHHRDGQDEHDPEQSPELPDVVAVAGVTAVVLVPGVMLAGLTVMILVVDVLLAVCRLMVRAGVVGVLVVVVGVAVAAGVLGAVIGMARVLPGMACVFLVCR